MSRSMLRTVGAACALTGLVAALAACSSSNSGNASSAASASSSASTAAIVAVKGDDVLVLTAGGLGSPEPTTPSLASLTESLLTKLSAGA